MVRLPVAVVRDQLKPAVEVLVDLVTGQYAILVDIRVVRSAVAVGIDFFSLGPILRIEPDDNIGLPILVGIAGIDGFLHLGMHFLAHFRGWLLKLTF